MRNDCDLFPMFEFNPQHEDRSHLFVHSLEQHAIAHLLLKLSLSKQYLHSYEWGFVERYVTWNEFPFSIYQYHRLDIKQSAPRIRPPIPDFSLDTGGSGCCCCWLV